MSLMSAQIPTPWQLLSVIVDVVEVPTVIAAAFQPMDELVAKADLRAARIASDGALGGVTEVVERWIDGEVDAFDALTVRQAGGAFMQECWAALRQVRGGTVVSYGQLAGLAGRPAASRAAGTACATNLIAPFVPCHRVVRTGGDIGNYGFGTSLKRALLVHEGVSI